MVQTVLARFKFHIFDHGSVVLPAGLECDRVVLAGLLERLEHSPDVALHQYGFLTVVVDDRRNDTFAS